MNRITLLLNFAETGIFFNCLGPEGRFQLWKQFRVF